MMYVPKFDTLGEYYKGFDDLCRRLKDSGRPDLAERIKNAQLSGAMGSEILGFMIDEFDLIRQEKTLSEDFDREFKEHIDACRYFLSPAYRHRFSSE